MKDADVELQCHGLQLLFEELLDDILECNWVQQYFGDRERFGNEVVLWRAKKIKFISYTFQEPNKPKSACEILSRIQRGCASTLDSCIEFGRGRQILGSHNWAINFIQCLDSTKKTNASATCSDFLHTVLEFTNVRATPPVWLDNGIHGE